MTRAVRACVRALAAACGFSAGAALASEVLWRTQVDEIGLLPPSYVIAAALDDGTAVLSLAKSSGRWLVRIDGEGRVVSRERVVRSGKPVALDGGGVAVLDGEYESPEIRLPDICRVDRTRIGPVATRSVHQFDDAHHGPAGFLVQAPNNRAFEHTEPLYWFGRDCRIEPGPALEGGRAVSQILQDPAARAAYLTVVPPDRASTELWYAQRG